MKRLCALALCLLFCTGCSLQEPVDMFLIAGTALFWREQTFTMVNEMGDSVSGPRELPVSKTFQGTGDTVMGALYRMADQVDREIYYGKTKLILLEDKMPALQRQQALTLFRQHRRDGRVLLASLRGEPEAVFAFGEGEQLRTDVITGLIEEGAHRCVCRPWQVREVLVRGGRAYYLPEITVDKEGARLSGVSFYKGGGYRGRLEGLPVRLLCLLDGAEADSASSIFGEDWAAWLKSSRLERRENVLHLYLEVEFFEGAGSLEKLERRAAELGSFVLDQLREMDCNCLDLPHFDQIDYRVAVHGEMAR